MGGVMAEIPGHADLSTPENRLWWERWAAVGDARDAFLNQRRVLNELRSRWGACRNRGLAKAKTCACGQCEARVVDAAESLVTAMERHRQAIAEFKGAA